jgi:HK97 gp10 family phage protein
MASTTRFKVTIKGDRELIRKFNRLADKEAKKVIRIAYRAAAKPIFNEVKRKCPVVSGKLKGTLKLRAMARSRVRIGMEIIAGSPAAPYIGHVELGTSHNPPNPFMRGTVDEYRPRFPTMIGQELGPALERVAKRS